MRKGTHLSDETKEKLRRANIGKRQSIETRRRISEALKGKKKPDWFGENIRKNRAKRKLKLGYINSPETRTKIGLTQIGRVVSIETKRKMSDSHRGSNGSRWEGGITPLNLSIRRSLRYREWRSSVFSRDNYTCKMCLVEGSYIEADHIKPFCIILQENNIKSLDESFKCLELWDINNGRTLCKKCHSETDTYRGKAKLSKNNLIREHEKNSRS